MQKHTDVPQHKKLIQLYLSFLKIGAFTLGGGYAMIPIIQHESVDNRKWVTEDEMTDFITIGQSLPGVVGINTATTVGNKVLGLKGALAATLGMITPSIVIIILIAAVFEQFQQWELVNRAFYGVRAAVAALIFIAVIRLIKSSVKDVFQCIIAILAFICIVFVGISPPYVILASGIAAILHKSFLVNRIAKSKNHKED